MGPFPHDAPAATISADNPMGTDGFEFVEYAHPNPAELHALFRLMGYDPVAKHKTKKITVYRQGDINYLVNEEPGTHGFNFVGAHNPRPEGAGLFYLDHLTHNVHRGRMDVWTNFYEKLFNFRQIRFFDIEGRASGLFSRALTSPDGKIRIPINEDAGDSGQIEE